MISAPLILLIIFLIVVLVVGTMLIFSQYNSFKGLTESINKAESNIDVLFNQRYEELKNLLNLAREYKAHETKIFSDINDLLNKYENIRDIYKKSILLDQIQQRVPDLVQRQLTMPEIRSSVNYLQIQGRLSEIETSISDRYELFNQVIEIYNTRLSSFPFGFVGKLMGLKNREMFKISDDKKSIDSFFNN